ncbi:MAG: hypothetical protein ACK6DI_13115 [Betaproteobacteria bacterium]
MSQCTAQLTAAVAGASVLQSGCLEAARHGASRAVMPCPDSPALLPDPQTRQAVDDKVVCAVMCCCKDNPVAGSDGQSLQQVCVHQVFDTADRLLGYRSRYKSEISYNMRPEQGGPPVPFMHRDGSGADTTEPSRYWRGRANEEIRGFRGGQGLVRRPDLVIVDDPSRPPAQGNIERVMEMKFGRDPRDRFQDRAYRDIAGSDKRYQVFRTGGTPQQDDEHLCNCGDERAREQVRELAAFAPQPERSIWPALGWSALVVAGAVATVALAAMPLDGPAGEAAAGAGTAAAFARARAAWAALTAAPLGAP